MKQNNKQLSESLYENDLQWLVSDTVLIDMHKTKLGKDADYVVMAIPVNDKNPAVDLAQFLESSVHSFLDIEVSPGMDASGRYLVYVEFERDSELYSNITNILADASRLSGIADWKFKTTNTPEDIRLDQDQFNSLIILSPEEYSKVHPEQEEGVEAQEKTDKEPPQSESVTESIRKRLKFLMDY